MKTTIRLLGVLENGDVRMEIVRSDENGFISSNEFTLNKESSEIDV